MSAEESRKKPVMRPSGWAVTGVAAACYLSARTLTYGLCLPAAVFLLLFRRGVRREGARWLLAGMAGALAWMFLYSMLCFAPAQRLWGESGSYRVTAVDYSAATEWGSRVDVRVKPRLGCAFRARIYLDLPADAVRPGDVLDVTAKFVSPRQAFEAVPDYYTAQGIFAVTSGKTEARLYPARRVPLSLMPKVFARALRERVSVLFDGDGAGMLMALLTGSQEELSDALGSQLSRTGLRHLIAVSGLHVSFLTGMLLLLPGDRRVRSLLAIPVLVGFCALTGASPSIFRATVMGICALVAPFFRRERDSAAALRTSFLLLMLHNPYSICGAGLQLTFAAVGGILLLERPLERWLRTRTPLPRTRRGERAKRWVCGSLSVTLSATALTLPLTVLYFGTISLIAPLANLLALWAATLIFAGGVLVTVGSVLSLPLAQLLALPVKGVLWYFFGVVEWLSRLPFCAITTQPLCYRIWLGAVYLVVGLLLLRPSLRRRAWRLCAGLAALLVAMILLNRAILTAGGLGVEAVDVGQGQSILLLSRSQAAAVDCGGLEAGDALADALEDVGENQLDLLLLTHFDSDHINGTEQLLRRVRVGKLAIPDVDAPEREEIAQLARAAGTTLCVIRENETVSFGEAQAKIFAPVSAESDNDSCLSVLAETEGFSVLITGDMSAEAEELLAAREQLTHVDVLVAGHHGSRTSTGEALLRAVSPETVLISAGRYNRYGHPARETLERLEKAGCRVLRTDRQGTVRAAASPMGKEE